VVGPGDMFVARDRLGVLRCPPWSLVAGRCGGGHGLLVDLALRLRVGA
jgi:hypothetical protein